ncbi:hypothetical protein C8F04DRAFT_1261161 [Mycena alexandri]|uniref:Uncharacterized protein n=1 Tax=Mycena alexandri TaxID=1745969 RepID=A0AAD6X5N8_9AGAR|nr:hypothetical protein C8F04DRAFT_1261161 [Mycena alexandri]
MPLDFWAAVNAVSAQVSQAQGPYAPTSHATTMSAPSSTRASSSSTPAPPPLFAARVFLQSSFPVLTTIRLEVNGCAHTCSALKASLRPWAICCASFFYFGNFRPLAIPDARPSESKKRTARRKNNENGGRQAAPARSSSSKKRNVSHVIQPNETGREKKRAKTTQEMTDVTVDEQEADADDETDGVVGKRGKKKMGPDAQRREKNGPNQSTMGEYLVKELGSLLQQQQEVTSVITTARTNGTSVLAALAPSPIPILDQDLHAFLSAYAEDPLHLDVDEWVARGVLVEDVGQIEADNTARSYIRLASVPTDHVLSFISGKMYSRPVEIPWLALVLLAHGIPHEDVFDAVQSALTHYGLQGICSALEEPIQRLSTIPFQPLHRTLTLTNAGDYYRKYASASPTTRTSVQGA